MKKIIVDGTEIEVLDYQWRTEQLKTFRKYGFAFQGKTVLIGGR